MPSERYFSVCLSQCGIAIRFKLPSMHFHAFQLLYVMRIAHYLSRYHPLGFLNPIHYSLVYLITVESLGLKRCNLLIQ